MLSEDCGLDGEKVMVSSHLVGVVMNFDTNPRMDLFLAEIIARNSTKTVRSVEEGVLEVPWPVATPPVESVRRRGDCMVWSEWGKSRYT